MSLSLETQTTRLELFSAAVSAVDLVADGAPVVASAAVSDIPFKTAAKFEASTGVLQSVELACSVKNMRVVQTISGAAAGSTEYAVLNTVGDHTIASVLHARATAGGQEWRDEPGTTAGSVIAATALTAAALVGTGPVALSGTAFRVQAAKTSGDAGAGVYAQLYNASGDFPVELGLHITYAYLAHADPSFESGTTVRSGLQLDLGSAAAGEFVPAALVIYNLAAPSAEASPAVLMSVSGTGDFSNFLVTPGPGLSVPSGGSATVSISCVAPVPGSYATTITLAFSDAASGYPSTVDSYLLTLDATAIVIDPEASSEAEPEQMPAQRINVW